MLTLFLDARYEKVRQSGQVRDAAVLLAVGVNDQGKREVLGVSASPGEHEVHWRTLLKGLQGRGLSGVELVISDDHRGLKAARQAVLGGLPWQRCQFHLQQNAQAYVPRQSLKAEVAADIRAIFNAPDVTPTVAPATSDTAAAISTATVTSASSGIFIPIAPGAASGEVTPAPAGSAYPAAPAASPTPAPPTPTPEPEFPAYTGPPLDRDQIGIQVYLHRQDVRELLRHFEALNVGWVKVQVSWKLHEPQPGEYSEELFGELDRLIAGANGQGIKVLLSVSKAPEWSRPTTEMDGPPGDYALFEGFMRTLATRYTGQVAAYELWNEANLQREWNGTPLNAADFVELMRRGAAGVRAADPAALIISGAPATTGINDGVNAIDDRVYFGAMLAAGAAEFIDGAGVHPYGWANPPDARAADPTQVSSSHNNHPSFFFADTLADYRALLVNAGADSVPLWPTEFGWGTFAGLLTDEGQPATPPAGSEFMADNNEWEQAVYTLRAFELGQEWDWVGPMFLWNLNFTRALGPEFQEVGYSLLRFDDSRRPAYRALEHRDE